MFGFGARRLRQAAFIRIGADPVALAWTGVGRFYLPADSVVTDPSTPFLGIGWIQNLPGLRSLSDDTATRLSFTMGGVDAKMQGLVNDVDADIEGAAFDLGFAILDNRRRLVGPVYWRLSGRVESLGDATTQAQGGVDAAITHHRSVTLNVIVGDGARRTQSMGLWTESDLGRYHPTDAFYARVPTLTPDKTYRWPPK